jgi:Flp pilus assembly protein TadD
MHVGLLALFFGGAAAMTWSEYRWNRSPGGRGHPDNLADLVPRSGYANFMKATRLRAEGKADSAAAYFEKAIRYDSAYGFSHAFIGELKQQSGDYRGAIAHYARALETAPGDMALRENLAGLYLKTGDFPEAFSRYGELAEREPGNPEYAYWAGFSLLQMKKGLSAKPYLEKSLRLSPDQPDALNYLGMIQQALGHADSARQLYVKALRVDSNHAEARRNLAGLPAE